MIETMAERGHGKQRRAAAVAAALLALAGLLVLLAGLTLFGSLVGLTAAAPPLLLLSPVLVPAATLAWVVATGAVVSAVLALGALSILSRLLGDCCDHHKQQAKQRIGELAAVAGNRTPHAALAVVSPGQGLTDHKKAKDYQHYVAGRMVQDDA